MEEFDKEFFERRMDLFTHDGWKELVEEWGVLKESNNSIEVTQSAEEFWQRKGFVAALSLMINLEDITKQTIESNDAV